MLLQLHADEPAGGFFLHETLVQHGLQLLKVTHKHHVGARSACSRPADGIAHVSIDLADFEGVLEGRIACIPLARETLAEWIVSMW